MRILIKGYYGHNNLGDDFILYSILNSLNAVGKFNVTVVSSGHPYGKFFDRFPNLQVKEFCKEWRRFMKRFLLMRSDLWIIGGGGLWPSEKSKNVHFLLDEIRFAKSFGCKIVFYGIDINSINEESNRIAWKQILDEADLFIVRNRKTKRLLDGLKDNDVIKSSDITFGLQTEAERAGSRTVLVNLGLKEKEYIVWAIPNEYEEGTNSTRYQELVQTLQTLANKSKFASYTHVLLPFNYEKDLSLLRDLKNGMIGNVILCDEAVRLTIEDKRLLYKYAKTSVCMRFHAIMFSLYFGLPGVYLSYSDKASDVLKENGLDGLLMEYGIKADEDFYREFDFNAARLMEMANELIANAEHYGELALNASMNLTSQASKSAKIFENFITAAVRKK